MTSQGQSAPASAIPQEDSLARRLAAAPFVSDADEATQAKIEHWLSAISDRAVSDELRSLFGAYPRVQTLARGLAAYSPYLWDLASFDPARFLALLKSDPDVRFQAILSRLTPAATNDDDEQDLMRVLRRAKSEAALLIGLCDIGQVWPIMQVTRALTELADATIQCAVHHLLGDAIERGKLVPADPAKPETGSGYIVLAMGKMGAFELNYSSDVDLIVFFDPAAPALAPNTEAQALYIRVTRGLVKLMQERTVDGYVFRVDVRLRPDPASTHIAISTPAAIEYYETRGQNWERSAMIKARACAGDIAAGETLLRELSPFVWRKSMDFAALADIHAMKRQIHAYKGHGEIAVSGHNIKLGRGGIREIEFFVQTQQLIAGGRHPELRDRGTLATLRTLATGGWIAPSAANELEVAYLFLRTVEHRLQMQADEQTHTLPDDREGLELLARFLGFPDCDAFAEALVTQLKIVQGHYARLFEQGAEVKDQFSFPRDADDRATLDRLAAKGFRNPLEVSALVRGWLWGTYPALKSETARAQLGALVPVLLDQLSRTESRDAALQVFDRFLARLPQGSAGRFFPLLTQNQELLGLILMILATAPRLGDALAHHPQVMDGLLDPKFFGAIPDRETLHAELARSLEQSSSYEDFLDRLRLFGQEHLFLIGARILSGTVFAGQAGDAFARLAEVIIGALRRATEARFAEGHGRVAGQQTAILAMGKLGGREMTAASDLDLILVYDFDEDHPQSDGARPLYGGQYFARLTQRLISALTAQTNYGALYQVDMRLRPSGRSGPVATQLGAFRDYQETEAWTWEHMALTRGNVVSASSAEFADRVEATIREVLCRPRDAQSTAADAAEMRQAIAREKSDKDIWDLKYVAGGLIDLEFIAQYLQLVHAASHPDVLDTATARVLDNAARLGLLAPESADILRPAARLYQDLSQILRLCVTGPFVPAEAGASLLGLLTRAADVPDFPTLEAHLSETQARVRHCFRQIIGDVN